jgi:uncharacterized membrane protein YkoI
MRIRSPLLLSLLMAAPACLWAQDQSPAPAAQVVLKEEKSGLLAQAKVTDATARAAALAKVPGGAIVEAEIEEEKGKLIYSYDIKIGGKDGLEEVTVDARTGAVLSVEHESAAAEAGETPRDIVPKPN